MIPSFINGNETTDTGGDRLDDDIVYIGSKRPGGSIAPKAKRARIGGYCPSFFSQTDNNATSSLEGGTIDLDLFSTPNMRRK